MGRRALAPYLLIAAGLCACRAGPSVAPIPPAARTSQAGEPAGSMGPARPWTAIRFESIGPTHMSDGFPTSGKLNAFAINPKDHRTIYTAGGWGTGLESYSSAGIYRTTDAGSTWQPIDDGLTDSSGAISSVINGLWLDPADPSVLLAASEYGGIFRSANGGSSWHNVYRTEDATQFAQFRGVLYASAAAGLLASSDDGLSWSVALRGTRSRHPTAFGVAQGSAGAFYAGMSDGSIYRFANGMWSKVGGLPYVNRGYEDNSAEVHQIAVDPRTPSVVYANENDGTWNQDLFASTDGGRTWTKVLNQHPGYYWPQTIAFSVVHPHKIYVGIDGYLTFADGDGRKDPPLRMASNLQVVDLRDLWVYANGADDGCWIASDQGLDYQPQCSTYRQNQFDDTVYTKTLAIGLARHFTVSPDGSTLLISLQDFSSHLTRDGGHTWQLDSGGVLYEDGFNELRPGNPSICYVYDEVGLRISTNGCVTFGATVKGVGLATSRVMTAPLAFDQAHPLTMYFASASEQDFGMYGSTNGGKTVSKLAWPFQYPGCVVVDAHNGRHVVVSDMGTGKATLSASFDGGKSWRVASGVPTASFWQTASISPVNGSIVLAADVDANDNVYVLRSTNGGRSFQRTATVVNAPLIRGRKEADENLEIKRPPYFDYSPVRELRFNQDVRHGVSDAVLTTLRGAFLSTDNGSTWHRLDSNLVAHSFWGTRWRDGYLYLASDGQGVLKSSEPVQEP